MMPSDTVGGPTASSITLPERPAPSDDLAPLFIAPRERFLEFRNRPGRKQTLQLGMLGIIAFFGIWEIGHHLTPESGQKFLPSVVQVISTMYMLFAERGFINDVLVSCMRVFVSFFVASAIAVPLGILMGSFGRVRALINPTVSGWRYLPAASFIPVLLVWFGPSETAKIGLLIIGVVFFLTALTLDNTSAVPNELIEASLTMGGKRHEVLTGVIVPAAAPAILDSMRNMIAVGWTYLVIAEIIGAQDGIGAVMMRAGRFLHVDIIMAGILTIGVLGVLTDLLFRGAQHLLFPWAKARQG